MRKMKQTHARTRFRYFSLSSSHDIEKYSLSARARTPERVMSVDVRVIYFMSVHSHSPASTPACCLCRIFLFYFYFFACTRFILYFSRCKWRCAVLNDNKLTQQTVSVFLSSSPRRTVHVCATRMKKRKAHTNNSSFINKALAEILIFRIYSTHFPIG